MCGLREVTETQPTLMVKMKISAIMVMNIVVVIVIGVINRNAWLVKELYSLA